MSKFFVCYRRSGDPFAADAIYKKLVEEFGHENIFMDVEGIPLGVNFDKHIRAILDQCDGLLAVIDKHWLDAEDDETGKRRLDDPEDFVRIEIEEALDRGMLVIPLLVGDATMPKPRALPESLQELAYSHGTTLRPGPAFDDDVRRLIDALRRAPEQLEEAREASRHFLSLWESGDWVAARRTLEAALERGAQSGLPPYRMLQKRREIADRLAQSVGLLERKKFGEAREELEGLELGDGPPNLEAARKVAALGERLTGSAPAPEEVDEIERELQGIVGAARERAIEVIPGEREVGSLLEQARRDADYLEACELYGQGRFQEARQRFEKLGSYRDAETRIDLCDAWLEAFGHLRERAWDEAKAKLRSIRDRETSSQVDAWLQWTNKLRIWVPVLERMASGRLVADPRVRWDGGECPYELLGESPTATPEALNELAYGLQERSDGMSRTERQAWDALRRVEQRLRVDFSLYRVQDPSRAERVLGHLCALPEGQDPDAILVALAPKQGAGGAGGALAVIGSVLGPDRGVFHALLRDYDAAIDLFLQEARDRPEDPWAFHHLGLAAAGKIQAHRSTATDLGDAWEALIQGWGAVFGDDRFWHQYWADRRRIYKVDGSQIQDARHELQRFWLDEVKGAADRYPGLDLQMQAEVHGARAVQAGGGIPLTRQGKKRAVVGLLGARAAELETAVSRWIVSFGPEKLREEGWQRRVSLYFSPLAEAASLAEEGRFEEVLRTASAAEFRGRDPGFAGFPKGDALFEGCRRELLEQAHGKIALASLSESPVDVPQAMEHWRRAVELARRRGAVEDLLAQIRTVTVGRASFLAGVDEKRRLDALNDAVNLVQSVLDEGWDRDQEVQGALIETLLNRAVHLSNEYDAERDARLDAQRAWSMAPHSLRAISVLCAASLYDARDLFMSGKRPLAEALLKEVEQHLAEGERLYPDNAELAACRENAGHLRRMLTGEGTEALAQELGEITSTTAGSTADPTRNRLSEAILKEARQEFAEAIDVYWELAQADPEDQGLRGMMAWCYRSWIQYLRATARDSGELRRVIAEALERCPGFDALSDVGDLVSDLEEESDER